jgi:MinD-like ATPase involved in chromosome partitioning or flagellar assembly
MKKQIRQALLKLDANNDLHWYSSGLPMTAIVAALADLPNLTAEDIIAAAPTFTRSKPDFLKAKEKSEVDFTYEEESVEKDSAQDSGQELTLEEVEIIIQQKNKEKDDFAKVLQEAQKQYDVKIKELDIWYERREQLARSIPFSVQKHVEAMYNQRIAKLSNAATLAKTLIELQNKV